MRIHKIDPAMQKGWFLGPWNSDLAISVGYATMGIDEPHVHVRIREVYLVASGTATLRIETVTVLVEAGDMVVIEPGEAHTFLSSTADYLHFVLHIPGISGAAAQADKRPVSLDRLGL